MNDILSIYLSSVANITSVASIQCPSFLHKAKCLFLVSPESVKRLSWQLILAIYLAFTRGGGRMLKLKKMRSQNDLSQLP